MIGWLLRLLRSPANGNGKAALREAQLRRAHAARMTPRIERAAERVAEVPNDEFADRVARAFRRRMT